MKIIIYFVVAAFAASLVYVLLVPKNSSSTFLSSPDAKFAFEIFPGPMTPETNSAIAGFNITNLTLPDGSTKVSLTSTNPEYQSQEYTVMPGYKLYFIEKSLGDDSEQNNTDNFLKDDSAVLVDPQGVLVQP